MAPCCEPTDRGQMWDEEGEREKKKAVAAVNTFGWDKKRIIPPMHYVDI